MLTGLAVHVANRDFYDKLCGKWEERNKYGCHFKELYSNYMN
jgi:hypothetical protein